MVFLQKKLDRLEYSTVLSSESIVKFLLSQEKKLLIPASYLNLSSKFDNFEVKSQLKYLESQKQYNVKLNNNKGLQLYLGKKNNKSIGKVIISGESLAFISDILTVFSCFSLIRIDIAFDFRVNDIERSKLPFCNIEENEKYFSIEGCKLEKLKVYLNSSITYNIISTNLFQVIVYDKEQEQKQNKNNNCKKYKDVVRVEVRYTPKRKDRILNYPFIAEKINNFIETKINSIIFDKDCLFCSEKDLTSVKVEKVSSRTILERRRVENIKILNTLTKGGDVENRLKEIEGAYFEKYRLVHFERVKTNILRTLERKGECSVRDLTLFVKMPKSVQIKQVLKDLLQEKTIKRIKTKRTKKYKLNT